MLGAVLALHGAVTLIARAQMTLPPPAAVFPAGTPVTSKPCAAGQTKDCIDLGNCIVYTADNHYDLSSLSKPGGYASKGEGDYDYFINFCKPITKLPPGNCATSDGQQACNTDPKGCSAYQVSKGGGAFCYSTGNVQSLQATFFDPNSKQMGDPSGGLTLMMVTVQTTRWTVIRLECGSAQVPGKLQELGGGGTGIYELTWSDPAGCPVTLGFGVIFLISFGATSLVYFGGGAFWNMRTKGQLEIPHADFWFSLPDLCKDGYYYASDTTHGLKGKTGAEKSSYEGL